ncbi:MBL fold metallo-hydrolase [Desulfovibrio sp. JC022]|uniref:MBL fold metallo-hydrolase n=1 Tax=Desulfovibrio sp. JC022 TaxID=2593642 RepID=UPI0010AA8ED0|nr:MBL fold metallo-hydrolase [Desulfovibrio sp. JC022]NDV24440.1 MBL fold metallo-hydrolase [Desulfovibrio sp. JC022]TIH12078.1 MBL fold metallo-hydrolase [Marinifilum sp. JC120]
MKIIIHRGTNEIGGSCVEVENNGTRILLDAGSPLDDSPAFLPDSIDSFDGVFISHGHQDHYGLIEHLPDEVPLYIGDIAWKFMNSLRLFLEKPILEVNNKTSLDAGKSYSVGSISVTPYLVDHSAPQAFGFLIEGDGKRIYYSGDFRSHGRKSQTFDYLCKNIPQRIDAILLEGTMMKRDNLDFSSETDVEKGMVESIKSEEGLVLVSCSSQNIDRIVSLYRATKRTGRTLVVDIYTAWILRLAQQMSSNLPDISWDNMKVFSRNKPASGYYKRIKEHHEFFGNFKYDLYKKENELSLDDLRAAPSAYVLKMSDYWLNYVKELLPNYSSTVIYSQWAGYLDEGASYFNENAANLQKLENSKFELIHTSGHAVRDDLIKLVESIKPRTVIPMHTEHKDMYTEYFKNVHILEDGEVYKL